MRDKQTFKTLNKDILLERQEDGTFDRVIYGDDWYKLEGMDSLAAGIRIKLQTWYGEMRTNPTYKDFGNKIYLFLKELNTELTRMALKEEVKNTIKEMRRVKSVDNVDLAPYYINGVYDSNRIIIQVALTALDDTNILVRETVG